MASLYLGRGSDATHLIDLIDEALEKNPDLQVRRGGEREEGERERGREREKQVRKERHLIDLIDEVLEKNPDL